MSGSQQLLLGGIPTAVPVDPYFYSVTSLLHGDGVNGGQNNTFLDSSSNNFTITRNGNTTQGSFSPFSQTGWGNYFNGTNNTILQAPNGTAFQFPGDFTIDFWFYPTSFANYSTFFDGLTPGSASGARPTSFLLYGDITTGTIKFFTNSTTSTGTGGPQLNTWNFISLQRSGSTITVYVNGLSVLSLTNSTNFSNGYCNIGSAVASGDTGCPTGYLSNFRIVKGSALSPSIPTAPSTAVSGTSLLTCQANRFLDASSNAFAITVTGSPSVQPFSPFNPTTAYSTSAVGGSGYFDGSGDYLSVPDAAAFTLGTSDFCMESWVYPTNASTGASESILGQWSSASYGWIFQYRSNALLMYYSTNGSSTTNAINASATVVNNAWNHIAFVRSGNTLSAYVNGTRVSTNASFTASIVNSSSTVNVGRNGDNSEYVTGYLNGTRLVVGSSVYDPSQSSITVPTAPLTAITNTSLLCNFTNGAIFDNAADADYETVGNAQISTSVKKYGTGSIAFDGTGDYLPAANKTLFDIGGEDFTAECWVNFNSLPADYQAIFSKYGADYQYQFLWDGANSRWFWNVNSTVSGNTTVTFSDSLSTGVWYHIALVRIGTSYKVYKNGTQVGTTQTISGNIGAGTRPFTLGSTFNGSNVALYFLNGYIDDFRFTKGIARYPYNFTPPTAEFPNIGGTVTLTADPYYEYTTLLLPGNGTNGAQNNTFLDSSTNAFSITRNGNTTQGTFSPFSQTGWSNYFDGSGDWLSVANNAALNLGTGDFTIECWVYPDSSISNVDGIIGKRNQSTFSGGDWRIAYISASTAFGIACGTNTTDRLTPAITLNSWNHIAFVRSSGTLSCYANGVRGANLSWTDNLDNTETLLIGLNVAGFDFPGYISNVRIVKGTGVYSGATYTVPTTPLTAITNTSLLTCQSNRFRDASTNNFTITRNGDVSVQAFSPFNPTAAWSAATNGGSGYFDGSGDFLTLASNTALDMGTGNFTVEMWVYSTDASLDTQNRRFFATEANGSGSIQLGHVTTTTGVAQYCDNGSLGALITGTTNILNQWAHIAAVRSGTTVTLYVNGVSEGTATDSGNKTSTAFTIGKYPGASGHLKGWLGSLRVVKGTAVYTGTFTPPTSPLTAISGTSLLLNYTNAGIYDATSKNDLETVGNAQISTTQSKFGGSSMYFDGTGDWLQGRNTRLLDIGSGDFTIEGWLYPTTSGTTRAIVAQFNTNGTGPGWTSYLKTTNVIEFYGGSGTITVTGTGTVSANAWSHFAICRYGSTITIYVNGIAGGTGTNSSFSDDTTGPVEVGARGGAGAIPFTGYIDDLRITKGIARYTSNFTPPSTAFLTL